MIPYKISFYAPKDNSWRKKESNINRVCTEFVIHPFDCDADYRIRVTSLDKTLSNNCYYGINSEDLALYTITNQNLKIKISNCFRICIISEEFDKFGLDISLVMNEEYPFSFRRLIADCGVSVISSVFQCDFVFEYYSYSKTRLTPIIVDPRSVDQNRKLILGKKVYDKKPSTKLIPGNKYFDKNTESIYIYLGKINNFIRMQPSSLYDYNYYANPSNDQSPVKLFKIGYVFYKITYEQSLKIDENIDLNFISNYRILSKKPEVCDFGIALTKSYELNGFLEDVLEYNIINKRYGIERDFFTIVKFIKKDSSGLISNIKVRDKLDDILVDHVLYRAISGKERYIELLEKRPEYFNWYKIYLMVTGKKDVSSIITKLKNKK